MIDKKETAPLKGLAALILVYFHAVGISGDYVWEIPPLKYFASRTGNVCVVIFAFITVYGLTKKLTALQDTAILRAYPRFAARRVLSLYQSFWPAYLLALFVSLVFQLLSRVTDLASLALLTNNYGTGGSGLLHALVNFLGLSHALYGNNMFTLNQTWWYMGLAFFLVLLTPLYTLLCRKHASATLAVSILLAIFLPWGDNALRYLKFLPLLAVAAAKGTETTHRPLSRWQYGLCLAGVAVWAALRLVDLGIYNDLIDSLAAYPLIELLLLGIRHAKPRLTERLAFLGRHSANLFYLHSFIYTYWPTAGIVNFFRFGILVLAVTLTATLGLSILLERCKARCGWDRHFAALLSGPAANSTTK